MRLFSTPKLSPTLYAGMDCYAGNDPKRSDKDRWMLCKDIVRDYFDIPDDADNVKFIVHDCPGAYRVKISRGELDVFTCGGKPYSYYIIIVDDDDDIGFFERVDQKIQKLLKKHKQFYVECHYEG